MRKIFILAMIMVLSIGLVSTLAWDTKNTIAANDVAKISIDAPTMAIEGYNRDVQTTVANLGLNAAAFDDSTYIAQIQKASYLFEDFEGDWGPNGDNPPAGWTIYDYGDEDPAVWNNNDWYKYYYSSTWGNVASVYYSPVEHSNEWLITPAVDLSTVSQNIYMSFHCYYSWYANDTAYVLGSTDNFTTIDTLAEWMTNHTNENPIFDITSWAASQSNVKIAFVYHANDDMGWYVDDVEVFTLVYPPYNWCWEIDYDSVLNMYDTLIFDGDNTGATVDSMCPDLSSAESWLRFRTTEKMDVTLEFCGTDPVRTSTYIVLADGCPCTGFFYGDANIDSCDDGNYTIYFERLDAGDWYFPIVGYEYEGPFHILITAGKVELRMIISQKYHNNTGQTAYDLTKIINGWWYIDTANADNFQEYDMEYTYNGFTLNPLTIIHWENGQVAPGDSTWAHFRTIDTRRKLSVHCAFWTDQYGDRIREEPNPVLPVATANLYKPSPIISLDGNDIAMEVSNHWRDWTGDGWPIEEGDSLGDPMGTISGTEVFYAITDVERPMEELNGDLITDPSITWLPLSDFVLDYLDTVSYDLGYHEDDDVVLFRFEASGEGQSSAEIVQALVGSLHSGYEYLPGDANMYNGSWPPAAIGGDVTYLVNYFRGIETSLPCLLDGFWASGDANGDCLVIGSDVTRLINYLRGTGSLSWCPDYEPCWPTPGDVPAEAPPSWPNCDPPVFGKDVQIIPAGTGK